MITNQNIAQKYGLGQYAKQLFALLFCLLSITLYQHIVLYFQGLVDKVANQSMWLHCINQLGFTAVVAILFLFPFHFFENKRPGNGKKFTSILLMLIISAEYILTSIYLQTHKIVDLDFDFSIVDSHNLSVLFTLIGIMVLIFCYQFLARRMNWVGRFLEKVFPFVIVLFVMVFGMLFTTKKPINQNKFQHLMTDMSLSFVDYNTYHGDKEYPLLRMAVKDSSFAAHFKLDKGNPNIVVILVQGLGDGFIGKNASFKPFAPYLNKCSQNSLFWDNHLTNALNLKGAMTSFLGSMTSMDHADEPQKQINRNTLLSVLKEKGYKTAYYYGGNNALLGMDKFLFQDRVDLVIDKSKFDEKYQLSPPNENGTILGYPDNELFRKWEETYMPSSKPKFELFVNLSSATSGIPNKERYLAKVDSLLNYTQFSNRDIWTIKRQKSFFASMLFVDEAIKDFVIKHEQTADHENTIYVITGTHAIPFMAANDEITDFQTPLLLFGPKIKNYKTFSHLTSHFDFTPSILSLIADKSMSKTGEYTTWLGEGLGMVKDKNIPLSRNKNKISELVCSNVYYKPGKTNFLKNKQSDQNQIKTNTKAELSKNLKDYQAIQKYVLEENKIIPDSLTIFRKEKSSYTNKEMVWISSVFNGKNFDKAYEKARDLAHNGNRERALLLCQYILDNIPNHIDAMVLKGRIYAWNRNYLNALEIFKDAMAKNPNYADSYSAALDVCYWAKDKNMAIEIYEKMKENNVISIELDEKVQRCLKDPKILNTVAQIKFELDDY